jgi:DNA end-binding protein Ku
MRSVWKGSISFGLVNIPIAVYPATREEKVAFKQLRKKDLSPIRYKKVAEADDKEVPADEIVKGYEYEKGKWVVLEDKDFEEVQIESTHTIEITDFVELAQIDTKYFHKPYFLEAQKGGEKGYALLHRALRETQRIGIAKVAIRSREYLAAVKPDGLFLMLDLMHFSQEVLDPSELKAPAAAEPSAREIAMAKALIDTLASDWQPEQYADRYQEALMEMIDRKVQNRPKGDKSVVPRAKGEVIDLLAVLQESLAVNSDKRKKSSGPSSDPRKRSTAALVKQKRRTNIGTS